MGRSRTPLTVSKTIDGLKIVTVSGSGVWKTSDGRFEFLKDNNALTYNDVSGRPTEEVAVTTWSAWDTTIDDHAFNGDTGYDTLTEAVEWVARHLRRGAP